MQKTNLSIELDGKTYNGFDFAGLPLAAAAQVACRQIDQAADTARRAVLGDTLRALEYQLTAQEATAFAAGNYSGDVPPTVQAWMDAANLEAKPATDSILAEADAWKKALYELRALRLKGKQDVLKEATHDAVESIADVAINAIHASVQGIGNAA
ncbi:hypothetical protein [Pseudomonas juntendi]|uniref:hypothetical protein n=1 Tax=Pseudomonas juntendi TaxID=2666183 RepID=UPI000DB7D2BB|nr:hypothetical protein [Pseudomonas juntendi]MDG9890421.1 hypothetical protein [Pseudomonas juntendi]MDH0045115.1 hypothetical protein [Pseudomonas juntendi]PZR87436.1 MAG: hypothetical protein DI537_26350 [Stutzerimonas stutzeri]